MPDRAAGGWRSPRPGQPPARPRRPAQAGGRRRHGGQARRIGQEAVDHVGQPLPVELVVGYQQRRTGPLQHSGVGRLVVARRAGQRNQHRGQPHRGQLGHRRGSGPADDQIGGGQTGRHGLLEADRLVEERLAGGGAVSAASSSQSRSPTTWRSARSLPRAPALPDGEGGMVEPAGPQRAAVDEDEVTIEGHPEPGSGLVALAPAVDSQDLRPDRIAGDGDHGAGPPATWAGPAGHGSGPGLAAEDPVPEPAGQRGGRERQRRGPGAGPQGQPVGRAEDGILLGHYDGDAGRHRGQRTGHRCIAAGGQHHRRTVASEQPSGLPAGAQESPDRTQVGRGHPALDAPAGQQRHFVAGGGKADGLDAPLTPDEGHRPSPDTPRHQRLRGGQTGGEMADGPPTGDHQPRLARRARGCHRRAAGGGWSNTGHVGQGSHRLSPCWGSPTGAAARPFGPRRRGRRTGSGRGSRTGWDGGTERLRRPGCCRGQRRAPTAPPGPRPAPGRPCPPGDPKRPRAPAGRRCRRARFAARRRTGPVGRGDATGHRRPGCGHRDSHGDRSAASAALRWPASTGCAVEPPRWHRTPTPWGTPTRLRAWTAPPTRPASIPTAPPTQTPPTGPEVGRTAPAPATTPRSPTGRPAGRRLGSGA